MAGTYSGVYRRSPVRLFCCKLRSNSHPYAEEDLLRSKEKHGAKNSAKKNEAAKIQDFEKAANLRDQEKQAYDKVQELTLAVLEKEQRLKEIEEEMKKLKKNEKWNYGF